MSLLEKLNPEQRQAAAAVEGPVLIFAGAGSGKTRALTYRIAHMVRERKIVPESILAVTFTNKAAGEMKERIRSLIGDNARKLWAGTFHSICARILRAHGEAIGISPNFVIYDDSDQTALVKQSLSIVDLDPKEYKPADVLHAISSAKNELVGAQQFRQGSKGPFDEAVRRVYSIYQQKLRENNSLDFDDLLMKTVQLFQESPAILEHYQDRFHYLMVDEYQDINHAQYQFVKNLAAKRRNICVVGDDDQSIYGWRGSNVGIILAFEADYPEATVVKLEQNYRSTQKILECAWEVIKNNQGRADKRLWTQNREGDNIVVYQALSAEEEADWVARSIRQHLDCDLAKPGDYAILYRANAMSRVLEEEVMRQRIPYVIVGGIRFYERAIIKDFIAYLRILFNPLDGVALLRIVNTPTRGIGDKTVAAINRMGHQNSCSLYEALRYVGNDEDMPRRAREAVLGFWSMMESIRGRLEKLSVTEICRTVAEETGYLRALTEAGDAENAAKAENLMEFVSLAKRYEEREEDPSLQNFLEYLALISDLDQADDMGSQVSLMTIHAAKGLEFPIVFIVGMEEGMFPHKRSMNSESEIEEERRLAYVAITRAQLMLFISHARRRVIYGLPTNMKPSRFLAELPPHLLDRQGALEQNSMAPMLEDDENIDDETGQRRRIDIARMISRAQRNAQISTEREQAEDARIAALETGEVNRQNVQVPDSPTANKPAAREKRAERNVVPSTPLDASKYQAGDRVKHPTFGTGTVIQISQDTSDCIIMVAFPSKGVKKLAVSIAPLEKA